MIGIVQKYGEEGDQPIVELLSNCDRFIDIMNARQEKGCYNINGPRHELLDELMTILEFFSNEKKNSFKAIYYYLTPQTHKDLCWTIFGIVGMCKTYLSTSSERAIDQKRHGSDCCEHHFANGTNSNTNGCLADFRSFTAKSTDVRAQTFHGRSKENTSGDRSYFGSELTSKLHKTTHNRDQKRSFKLKNK